MVNRIDIGDLKEVSSEKYNEWKSFFKNYLDKLTSIDIDNIDNVEDFFVIPDYLLPRDNDGNYCLFSEYDIKKLVLIFISSAKELGFDKYDDPRIERDDYFFISELDKISMLLEYLFKSDIDREILHKKKELNKILNGGNSIVVGYMLIRTIKELEDMSEQYYKFLSLDLLKNSFTIYIARDSASLGEANKYYSLLKGKYKQSGIIYHGGLKVNHMEGTASNIIIDEVIETVIPEFLEEEKEYKHKPVYKTWRYGKKEEKTQFILKEEYEGVSDREVHNKFENRFIVEIHKRLEKGRNGGSYYDFYEYSKKYYNQMLKTGVLDNGDKVVFFDTTGTGKTAMYSKAVFDYFSNIYGIYRDSEVLLGERFSNNVDIGQSQIPGFPDIVSMSKNGLLEVDLDIENLLKENDVWPFFASGVDDRGKVILSPNPLSAQIMCFIRSTINWNNLVKNLSSI